MVSWYLVPSRMNDLVSTETLLSYEKGVFLYLPPLCEVGARGLLSLWDHFRCDGHFPAGMMAISMPVLPWGENSPSGDCRAQSKNSFSLELNPRSETSTWSSAKNAAANKA